MGTIPTNYTWIEGEEPTYAQMESRLAGMLTFLTNPPMVRLRKTTTQNLTTSTTTPIIWNFVEVETVNMWDASQPTRITPSVPGWYFGSAGVSFHNNATGYREMNVVKNNSATDRIIRIKVDAWADGTQTVTTRGHTFIEFFNGTTDYIEVTAWQNSGSTLAIEFDVTERQPDISLRWLAAL